MSFNPYNPSSPQQQSGSTQEFAPPKTQEVLKECMDDLNAVLKNCEAAKQKGESVSLGTVAQVAAIIAKLAPIIPQLGPKGQHIVARVSELLQEFSTNPKADMAPRLKKAIELIKEIAQ